MLILNAQSIREVIPQTLQGETQVITSEKMFASRLTSDVSDVTCQLTVEEKKHDAE